MKELNCISFSGGRTSAFMVLELLKDVQYQEAPIIFANTGKEKEQTLDFVNKVDKLIGGKVIWVEYRSDKVGFEVVNFQTASRKGEPYAALIEKRGYVPNIVTRFCTQELKIRPMKRYLKKILGWKHWNNLVGIRYDEPKRYGLTKTTKDVFDVVHPLVSWKITRPEVLDFWGKMPFDLQLADHEGNCDLCFLKGKKKKQLIAREDPSAFDWWIEQEKKTKATFSKGYSYEQLRRHVLEAPEFSFDDNVECFCNND